MISLPAGRSASGGVSIFTAASGEKKCGRYQDYQGAEMGRKLHRDASEVFMQAVVSKLPEFFQDVAEEASAERPHLSRYQRRVAVRITAA